VSPRHAHFFTCASLGALVLLCFAWEIWLAPLRPGGSWMALKALPLLAAAPGMLRGRVYTHQWALLLVLAYFTEGVVRAWSDAGPTARLAGIEITLSVVFFVSAIGYVRLRRRAA